MTRVCLTRRWILIYFVPNMLKINMQTIGYIDRQWPMVKFMNAYQICYHSRKKLWPKSVFQGYSEKTSTTSMLCLLTISLPRYYYIHVHVHPSLVEQAKVLSMCWVHAECLLLDLTTHVNRLESHMSTMWKYILFSCFLGLSAVTRKMKNIIW